MSYHSRRNRSNSVQHSHSSGDVATNTDLIHSHPQHTYIDNTYIDRTNVRSLNSNRSNSMQHDHSSGFNVATSFDLNDSKQENSYIDRRRSSYRKITPFTTFFQTTFLLLVSLLTFLSLPMVDAQVSPDWTIHSPANNVIPTRFPFAIDFTLPVAAVADSVKLTLTPLSGTNTADRVIILGDAAEALGRKTISIGQMTSPGAQVDSVTPAVDIEDGVSCIFMFQYMADDGSIIASMNMGSAVLEFDLATKTPTLSVTNVLGGIPNNFEFIFGLSEAANSGTVKLKITPQAGGTTDSNGVRTITLSNSFESISSTHTVTMVRLSQSVSTLAAVNTVSPDTDLIDGAVYSMVIEYQDQVGNPIATSVAVTGLTLDTSTLTPTLINPSISGIASVPINFIVTYSLPETAAPGTVVIRIAPVTYGAYGSDVCSTNSNQPTTRTMTLGTPHETSGNHQVQFRTLSEVNSVMVPAGDVIAPTTPTTMCDLTDGATYNFRISYQDVALNSVASDSQIIVFDSFALAVILSAPTGNTISPPIFDVTFQLQEEANVGTVKLKLVRTGGTADSFGDRIVTFINTIKDSTTYTIGLVALSTAVADVAEIASISPDNDLVHGTIYSVQILYDDRASNAGVSNIITGLQIDAQTDAPTLSQPQNNAFVPTVIPVTFIIPEQAKTNSVKIRFTKTATIDLGSGEGIEYYDYHELVLGGLTTPTNGGGGPGTAVTLNVPALSAAVSGLSEVTVLTVSPATGSETSSDLDLTHGTTYTISITYEDLRGNPASSAQSTGVEFSAGTTIAPTLTLPEIGTALTTVFDITYTLPEPALFSAQGGNMKLDVVTIGTDRDPISIRTITFSEISVALDRGTHSITLPAGGLGNIASDTLVQAISDTTGLVDGAEYDFRLFYEDRAANPTASDTSLVSFHGDNTLDAIIISPLAGDCLTTTFNLTFKLDERATAGTLVSTFTLSSSSLVNDPANARVITFSDTVISRGFHSIASGSMQAFSSAGGLSSITSIVPATNLVDGAIYDATLGYKDAAGNALNTVNFPGTSFYFGGATTQQHGMTIGGGGQAPASSGNIALGSNWVLGIYIPEPAASGTLQLRIARSDGVVDPNSPHIITMGVDLEAQSTLAVGAAGLNDPSKHVNTAITALSGLVGAQPVNKVASVTSNGGTAQDMVDGSLYRFTLSYQDCSGNTAVQVIRNLIAFAGSSTIPPDLAMASLIASPFTISFQTRERALLGSLKLIITYVGGFTDAVAERTIVFTAALGEPSLYSMSISDLSGLVAANSAQVASVTPDTDLVDGAEYNFVLSMEDAAGNDAATDSVNNVYFGGDATRTPRLYTPDTDATTVQAFTVLLFIAERASAGTVKLTFSRTGGSVDSAADRIVTLTSAFEAYGNHTFTLGRLSAAQNGQSEVATVLPAIDLVHMAIYTVTLSYQDLLDNPSASYAVTGVTHDILTESMDLFKPTTGTSIVETFALNYQLGEAALDGSLKMTVAYVSGITDSHGDRTVTLNVANAGTTGAHSFNLAAFSTASALAQVDAISPATDLVDGATYNFKLEYQDLFSNTKQERSQNGVVYAGSSTLPAIMILPQASVKVPQDFVVQFTIQELPKPDTLVLLISYTGVGTNDPTADRVITFVSSVQQVGTHIITLNAISKLLLKVPECVSVTPSADLINGAKYDVSIRYQDSALNAATTSTVAGVEFDIVTDVPTITAPESGNIKVDYTLTLVVPENAMGGTIRVEFNPISGDSAATRVVLFDAAFNTAGTHSIAMSALTSSITNVISVTPSIDLVHMAQYIVTMIYRDAIENAEATSGSVLMTHDQFTETPTIVLPAANTRFKEAFLIDFTLPEIALPSSVKMTFTRTGGSVDGAAARVLTFAGAYETAAQHATSELMTSFSTAVGTVSYVATIVPATDLVHMAAYQVKIDYQDTAQNVIASAIHTGAIFDTLTETPTHHSPANLAYPTTTFEMDFTLPENAQSGTVQLTIVPIAGGQFSDAFGSRLVRFASSVEGAGRHTFNMAALATIVNDVSQVCFGFLCCLFFVFLNAWFKVYVWFWCFCIW